MRSALIIAMWLAAASPALAQTCEGSAKGKAGEVFVAAAPGGDMATWILERVEGVGMESDHFARPALMLDFGFARGALSGPDKAVVSITRFSGPDVGRAPELSAVWVEAQLDGREVAWRASDRDGETSLAEALRAQWPAKLTIALRAERGAATALAEASFDLSARPAAEKLARDALASRACRG
jgi:hypothetical protein